MTPTRVRCLTPFFIIKEGTEIVQAIQVTTHMNQADIKKREVSGLLEALQQYNLSKGLILTLDEELSWNENVSGKEYTIEVQPLWKWLLAV